jgi:hypothetical protein
MFRYQLRIPTGLNNDRCALAILANPSTAHVVDGVFNSDPTVTRWINYCRSWGYGWALVGNARAYAETNPKLVPDDPYAIGYANDSHLVELIAMSDLVVCGWGKLGGARGPAVLRLIRSLGAKPHALKLNKDGSPAHPLYLRSDAKPFPMGDTEQSDD